jgi:ABC-type branched-subunit amino acid transport system substrate-binding protein
MHTHRTAASTAQAAPSAAAIDTLSRSTFLRQPQNRGSKLPLEQAVGAAVGVVSVGVLLPQSRVYPELAEDWLSGIQAGMGAARNARILTADAGHRLIDAVMAAEAMLDAGARIIVGMDATQLPGALDRLLRERDAVYVAAHSGARVVGTMHGPHAVELSHGFWQAAYALGTWTARAYGTRAQLIISYHDSNFDLPYAFEAGFAAAGGRITASAMWDAPGTAVSPLSMLERVRVEKPDAVCALFSGNEASSFVKAYAAAGLTAPIVGTPCVARAARQARLIAAGFRTWPSRQLAAAHALGRTAGEAIVKALVHADGSTGARALATAIGNLRPEVQLLIDVAGKAVDVGSRDDVQAVVGASTNSGWLQPYLCA